MIWKNIVNPKRCIESLFLSLDTTTDIYGVCLGHEYAKEMAASARLMNFPISSRKEVGGGLRLPDFGESAEVECGNGHGGGHIQGFDVSTKRDRESKRGGLSGRSG